MPYPNEHSCRLVEPDRFRPGSFRRVTRKLDGKSYDIIMGKLIGEDTMTEQAYRYDRKIWTVEQARRHCKDHGGRFEAASGPANEAIRRAAGR